MFILLIRDNTQHSEELTPLKTIFPRPTPFKIVHQAFFSFLLFKKHWKFVFLPPECNIYRYHCDVEGNKLYLRDDTGDAYELPLLDLSWGLWVLYDVEAFIGGPMLRIWEWRWGENSTMTRRELQAKLERIEADLASKTHKGSQIIGQDSEKSNTQNSGGCAKKKES